MTKLMLCGVCGDVVSPGLVNRTPRWCLCKRHAVWWTDSSAGRLAIYDKEFTGRNGSPGGLAWVIGLHNGLLATGGMVGAVDNYVTRREDVEAILEDTPSNFLFKTANSLAVRFYPGSTSDTSWADKVPY